MRTKGYKTRWSKGRSSCGNLAYMHGCKPKSMSRPHRMGYYLGGVTYVCRYREHLVNNRDKLEMKSNGGRQIIAMVYAKNDLWGLGSGSWFEVVFGTYRITYLVWCTVVSHSNNQLQNIGKDEVGQGIRNEPHNDTLVTVYTIGRKGRGTGSSRCTIAHYTLVYHYFSPLYFN